MQNSRIKHKYEKPCELCDTPLKWQEKPICNLCFEALKQLIKEKRSQEKSKQDKSK